jgi:DNA topoisomerase-1
MAQQLIIVESPAKAKTIKKYLGNDFQVLASYGHVRDLLPKSGAVDPDNHFAMTYSLIERNSKHVEAIAKALKKSDALYLATDPDREGEAISWHIYEIMRERDLLKDKPVHRVVFHEITKGAIQDAVANPRQLSNDLVDAQQARRALDYLVGFNLSPLLWKKIKTGLSAGRVQSPALRLIVEREQAIEAFVSQEYWSIEADLQKHQHPFVAKLTHWLGEKLEQFTISNADQAHDIKSTLLDLAGKEITVSKVEKKQRKRQPAAPFITSTLQQEAARKLGFSTKRTMQIAQQLYEGIDTGDGAVGLITYMRTDSVTLSQEAVTEIRAYIQSHYGNEMLPKAPRVFKNKSKNAQEAHEAIRPTSMVRSPESVKAHLNDAQFKLYQLVWKRALACQMPEALIDQVAVVFDIEDKAILRATGSVVASPGFMKVYQEGEDDQKNQDEGKMLPPMKVGDKVSVQAIRAEQHFTEPPPRYSEATLVKALEEYGIGRPSTYASIISTIQQRDYVTLEQKRFKPTDVGRIVNKFLTSFFTQYVDYDFTAQLEDQLDEISRGEIKWIPVLEKFWSPFHQLIGKIETEVKRSDVTQEEIDEQCPKCQKKLCIKLGRNGRFVGCTGYPDCDFTRPLNESANQEGPEVVADRKCPKCGGDLHIKVGRYGKFIGCSNYPNCKFIEPLNKPKDTGVSCPACKQGTILERRSRNGKIFYSCDQYPKCKYALWNPPEATTCPQCQWPIMMIKTTKKHGRQRICPECKFTQDLAEE